MAPSDAGAPDAATVQPRADAGADAGPDADAGIGWGNLQSPTTLTLAPSGRAQVYGQVWVAGLTDRAGASGLEAELGVGPAGTNPWESGWSFQVATFNGDRGNNDEFVSELTAPASGAFDFAFRYRHPGSAVWLYGDRSDVGRVGNGDGYKPDDAGKLAVRASGGALVMATLNLHCLNDNPKARLDAAADRLAVLGADAIAVQEACDDDASGPLGANAATYLASRLSTLRKKPFRALWEQTHLANGVTPEGIGILTSLPVADVSAKSLPTAEFPRKALLALLATPVGLVAFTSTHFSFRAEDAAMRVEQAKAVLAHVDGWQSAQVPVAVVAGDLNAIPSDDAPKVFTGAARPFRDAWDEKNPGSPGFTHSTSNPTRRIDYVFVRDASASPVRLDAVQLEFDQPYAATSYVSDHRGVSAKLVAP